MITLNEFYPTLLCLFTLLASLASPHFPAPQTFPSARPSGRLATLRMHACLSSVSTDRFTRFTACLLHRLAHLPSQSVICSIALCLSTQAPTLQLSQLPAAFFPPTSPAGQLARSDVPTLSACRRSARQLDSFELVIISFGLTDQAILLLPCPLSRFSSPLILATWRVQNQESDNGSCTAPKAGNEMKVPCECEEKENPRHSWLCNARSALHCICGTDA